MRFAIATVLASTLAATAQAADAIVYQEPAPAPVAPIMVDEWNWTGAYIGAHIGYGTADVDQNGYTDPAFDPAVSDPGVDGVLGGLHAGYNHDLGNFVVGGEVDYDFILRDLDGVDGEIDGIARAKLRAGLDLGRTLPYLTAGGAYAHGEVGDTDIGELGYVVGAGIDFAATDHIVIGAEYLYQAFSDIDDTPVDIDGHTIQARISYKF